MDITPFLPPPGSELPLPDADAQAHCASMAQHIINQIDQNGGQIDFDQFMALALYAPGLGYYAAGARKFGDAGDFVTAPELSPLFSRCLARQCQQVLAACGGNLLEFGAGSGTMAADILAELESLDALPDQYLIMEVSADLRERQRETIHHKIPHLAGRVHWLDQLPETFHGVIVANEVLDAMPVQRLRVSADGVAQAQVGADHDGFHCHYRRCDIPELTQLFDGLPEGYESEVNTHVTPWLAAIAASLQRGAIILIDYGFPRHEFYHPQRDSGTLMCHYRHRAHVDPLILPGLQDITAHVDFTAVAEAAVASGLDVAGFTNQAYFLLSLGLTELVAEINPADTRAQIMAAQQIKKLTLPNEMGELFKVMALTRDLDLPLRGFSLNDQRVRL